MYYKHGKFVSLDAEFGLRGFSRVRTRGSRGEPKLDKWTISGFFEIRPQLAAGSSDLAYQKAITARFNTIALAFRDGFDSGFLHQDLTPSAIYLNHGASMSGVLVTQLPDLQPSNGADYATGHTGMFSVQADYIPPERVAGSSSGVEDYREVLSFSGNGGPLTIGTLTDTAKPRIVETARYTFYQATQSGYAVGSDGWPAPNAPYWDSPILINPSAAVAYETPDVYSGGKVSYKTSWTYQFLSDEPLNKLPTIR